MNIFFKIFIKVNPGHFLKIDLDLIRYNKFHTGKYLLKITKEESEKFYLEKLDYLLNDSVKSHLQSDVIWCISFRWIKLFTFYQLLQQNITLEN